MNRAHASLQVWITLGLLTVAARPVGAADFEELCANFSTTTTLMGIRQAATLDANGAGINFWLPGYEGMMAINVPLSNPHMAQADAFGNVFIADKASHSILKITTDGRIHTVAGTHEAGYNGDGPAQATTLQISNPNGLHVLPNGVLYLLDPGNHRIRRVGLDGMMSTVVDDPDPQWKSSGRALWVSGDEQLIYYTNEFAPVPPSLLASGACVKKWTPTGGIETVCSKAVGFVNPGNLAVNPMDGKLYVTDRAEDDPSKTATGLWRIDGPDQRTRLTGNVTQPLVADGQPAITSFIEQTRGIAFLPNGAYFLCGHRNGSIWYVDTAGIIHLVVQGRGSGDSYSLPDGFHPPVTGFDYIRQPRAVTVSPNGSLLVVSNDSGYVFTIKNTAPQPLPADLRAIRQEKGSLNVQWSGLSGHTYVVERTFTLGPPDWEIIGAVSSTGGVTDFIDSSAASFPRAFYRLSLPR